MIQSRLSAVLLSIIASTASLFGQAPTITEIEVNQAIGKQLGGALKFVAGKNTVVRAFLNAPVTIDPAQTKLAVDKDGKSAFVLEARAYTEPTAVVEFLCPSREACGNWDAGDYRFSASVNGASLSTGDTKYTFRVQQKLRILVRPVRARYGSTVTQVQGERWKKAWEYVRDTYPVAADGIVWDVKDEFDASAPEMDLETDAGRANLWQGLTNLVPQNCATNRKAPGCYDLVVGFISDRPNGYPKGNLQGYTYGAPSNIVVASDDDMEATVAHEVAHIYEAGDTYDGGSLNCKVNPAPDGFNGKDFADSSKTTTCTDGKKTFPGASATLMTVDEGRPYQVGGKGALGDIACFMGSGGNAKDFWITREVYDRLFDRLDPALLAPKTDAPPTAATTVRALYFSGFISNRDVVKKTPWYTFQSTDPLKDSTGDYAIVALDANGQTLASQKLNVSFFVNSNPPVSIDSAPLYGAIRFPDGVAKFQIQKKGTSVFEVPVSAADPKLENVAPSLAGKVEGNTTFTWAGTAADTNPLFYMVEYNPTSENPDAWVTLATDLTSPQWTDNFDELPGGPKAKVRVTATDGIRSVAVESGLFEVPYKAPYVFIDDLPSGNTVKAGTDVILAGEADDLQDEDIPDAKLIWTSSISGDLGRGPLLTVKNLAPGEHTITLTATNSVSLKGTATVKITVVP